VSADFDRLPPPNEPAAFESLCLDLFREVWDYPGAQKNGRSGQPQAGVDVFGRAADGWVGVQCKQKDGLLRTRVTVAELDREVAAARTFRPALGRFLLATSGPRDGKVQERARELTEPGFAVEVWSWEDLWHELYQRRALFDRIFPAYWPLLAGTRARRVAPTRLRHGADRLFGREEELAALDAAWGDPRVHLVTLVAWGGVGKTSLVGRWVAGLAAHDFDGADYFDWSFYSQGTRDQGGASADAFIDAALRFFGDEAMAGSPRSPWEKGARLAQLVAERRTLLVLDGLEPLQHPPGPLAGELKDPAMAALLKGLAGRNQGLCVVTTRERVKDLVAFEETTAPRWPLEHLSVEAGVELLRSLRVHGREAELAKLVADTKGHALTLNLLGRFLRAAHGGDVRRRDRIRLREADEKIEGGHAFRVMAAYEGWLAPQEGFLGRLRSLFSRSEWKDHSEGSQQLAILNLLGLFDRPADTDCLAALRRPPAIQSLTDAIAGINEDQWSVCVSRLIECGLVASDQGTLDTHPLVREYFASRLRQQRPEPWKVAHGRLFDHLKATTAYRPRTLAGLQPLYQAVRHGCEAGRHREACDGIYVERILHGTGEDGYFSLRELGAAGADLGALACFFEATWSRPARTLRKDAQAWVLNEVATRLRRLGRLNEAIEPMRSAVERAAGLRNWDNPVHYKSDLSALELALGNIAGALRMATGFTLAYALHQAGRREDAWAYFSEIRARQAEPALALAFSLQGFYHCDLLLADGERAAGKGRNRRRPTEDLLLVERGAREGLSVAINNNWLLESALYQLALGRARLYRSIVKGTSAAKASEVVDQAVDGLRRAGSLEHLPLGLLTRAWLRVALGDAEGARADLDEAQEIAERGPMPLHLADVHLYRARLFHDRAALAEARRLADKHGYGRRREELEDLEARLSGG
jgi:hypothetical protein